VNRNILPLLFGLTLGLDGCGTYVPEIQDFGDSAPGDISNAGRVYVQDIVRNIRCDVSKAINDLYTLEASRASGEGLQDIAFLNDWGAQITLNLTVDEKGIVAPTSNITPLGQPVRWIFNLGLGASGSSEAQRVDKVSYIYLVSDLRKWKCPDPRQNGFMLLTNDLKFKEWLYDAVALEVTKTADLPANANGPLKSSILYYEVKFDVATSGTVSPGWKLVNATINQSGTFLTATRDRTHDLQITLGPATSAPIDPKKPNGPKIVQLSTAAANTALAGEISNGLANAISQQITVNPFFPLF
jgi:hypothetical protein